MYVHTCISVLYIIYTCSCWVYMQERNCWVIVLVISAKAAVTELFYFSTRVEKFCLLHVMSRFGVVFLFCFPHAGGY